jgi:hypothetical protein
MSVRTEPRADLSERLHGALHISADQLAQQGIKLEQAPASGAAMGGGIADTGGAVQLPNEHALAEANSFNVSNPEYPLRRTVVVSIRASLNDLCLRKQAATWAPNADAIKSILQQVRCSTDRTRIRARAHVGSHTPVCAAQVRRFERERREPRRPEVDRAPQARALRAEVELPHRPRPARHRRR